MCDFPYTQTENQPGMSAYVEIDECQDVLVSLDHCVICLGLVEPSPGAWKWVILPLHSALQGAMVCHLSGTAQAGALDIEMLPSKVEHYGTSATGAERSSTLMTVSTNSACRS